MPREWMKVAGANTLGGLIGAWGIKAGNFPNPADLLAFARHVFNIPENIKTCEQAANYVYALPMDERRKLGKAAVQQHPELTQKIRRKQSSQKNKMVSDSPRKAFYHSWDWKQVRYQILKERGARCECCGATSTDGVRIVVDHIVSVKKSWERRLDKTNLQVLCNDCNMGKGREDRTDWRDESGVIVPFPNVDGK